MGTAAASTNLAHGFPAPGPQDPTGQKVMENVFFLSHAQWKAAREEGTYDLVIIGSGICGLAVASRALARHPHCRILMIERGTFFLPEHFQNLPTPFVNTLGGLSETFPWSLSATTALGLAGGYIRWQHGMVPFFGGRSTLWSAWCPRPTEDEMSGWPAQTIAAAKANFDAAEGLLHVQKADAVDADRTSAELSHVASVRPIYGALQEIIQTRLLDAPATVKGIYRTEAAPLASDAKSVDGIDFQKFAAPAEILELQLQQSQKAKNQTGAPFHIMTDCTVERILQQDGRAIGLDTSRGTLSLGNAKLVLATGTLPPTTLVQNAFPDNPAGERFTAHFVSAITARVPRADLDPEGTFSDLQIGACYIGGTAGNFEQQYHIQLSCLSDKFPEKNAGTALRYMPDVVATASMTQLKSSQDHVVFVCAVLGELDFRNPQNGFRANPCDDNPTTNSLLQVVETGRDAETWDAMDQATFGVLEDVLSPLGAHRVEYWHGTPDEGTWTSDRPTEAERRVDGMVHEGSTLHIGDDETAPVGLDYKLQGADNVYITGGALWPQGGSWNPTMTMVALAFDLADNLVPKTQG
ncbi:GMC oxidoreductase [Yoonia sp.]|uniref:GMC oxidoreductase n=1 Tax=Yoonia sp. TaxID=2212373 RepID=UPI0025CE1C5A|nr:GMC oxidoreductase [Yoonia sp.]